MLLALAIAVSPAATWGQCHQDFWCQRRAAFAKIFLMHLMATAYGKIAPKCGARCKSRSLKYEKNFSRNVGETEQRLLRHLLYAGGFAHCVNWLVKLTPGFANVNAPLFLSKNEGVLV